MSSPSTVALFEKNFGREVECLVSAPGRVNLIGEHVDYLGGCVMPAAIARRLEMAAAQRGDGRVRVWSALSEEDPAVELDLEDLRVQEGKNFWLNYLVGVLEMRRRAGLEVVGFDAVITSDLPAGAGLSSSAALESASSLVLETLTGQPLDALSRARLCQAAEHEFAGVPCGLMDQLAVGLGQVGRALLIDCQKERWEEVTLPEGVSLLIVESGVKHALAEGEYARRRAECQRALQRLGAMSWREVSWAEVEAGRAKLSEEGEQLFRRARHVVTEMERVRAVHAALGRGDLEALGGLFQAGHASLRDDFEVSCAELDHLVAAAGERGLAGGVVAARMTGGGFGGSVVCLVEEERVAEVAGALEGGFAARFGREPGWFVTRADEGVRVER